MGKTVTMQKGDRFADIYDSPETIAQAQRDGYHLCTEAEAKVRKEREGDKPVNTGGGSVTGAGNTTTSTTVTAEQKTGLDALLALSKKELLEFAGKKKLYDKSFNSLEPADIIPKIYEKARAAVVNAGLKTEIEAMAITGDELFAVYDTLK